MLLLIESSSSEEGPSQRSRSTLFQDRIEPPLSAPLIPSRTRHPPEVDAAEFFPEIRLFFYLFLRGSYPTLPASLQMVDRPLRAHKFIHSPLRLFYLSFPSLFNFSALAYNRDLWRVRLFCGWPPSLARPAPLLPALQPTGDYITL